MSTFLTPKISNEVQKLQKLSSLVDMHWDSFLRTANRDRIQGADNTLRDMQALIKEIRSDLGSEDTYTAEAQEPQEVCS